MKLTTHNSIVFNLLFALTLTLFCGVEANAQTQRRRVSIDVGYSVHQEAINVADDFGDAEFYEVDEDNSPFTFGLNYRFTKRMSLYADYARSGYYFDLFEDDDRRAQFDALSVGFMPLSGFFEFGIGYTRFTQNAFAAAKGGGDRQELTSETFNGANLRLRFDIKLFEGASIYAGAMVYSMLPNDDLSEIDAFANGNFGVQLYLLGKDKKYISRKERKQLRKMQRERDLEDIRKMKEVE